MTHLVHPWRELRGMDDWTCRIVDLPGDLLGVTDANERTIYLQRGLTQAQRRATLAHELQHARRPGDREHCVDATAVRHLIPLHALIEALRWSRDEHELSECLWVDEQTVRARLDGLTADEQRQVEEALDDDCLS